jgi:hypothetical protein
MACLRSMTTCSEPRSRTAIACLRLIVVCSGPGSGMATSSRGRVKYGGALRDSMQRCLGHRDDDRWKILEFLLSVGRECA